MRFILVFFALMNMFVLGAQTKKSLTKAEIDASNIIRFGNVVIGMGNSYHSLKDNYRIVFEQAESNFDKVKRNSSMPIYHVSCKVNPISSDQLKEYTNELAKVPNFDEKADIVSFVKEGQNDIRSIEKWCGALSKYFSEKQYVDDKDYLRYQEIKDSLQVYVEKSAVSWSGASRGASEAGEKAEIVLLSKSPLAEFIIPMKSDLTALNNLFEMLDSDNINYSLIRDGLAKLSVSLEKNKDVSNKDLKKLKDLYYKSVYTDFYRECKNSATTLGKIVDKIEQGEEPQFIQSWYGSLKVQYGKAVESYNTFVGQ